MIRDEPPPPIDEMPDVWEGPAPDETQEEKGPGLGDVYGEQSADAPEIGELGTATADAGATSERGARRDAPTRSAAAVLAGHVVVPAATIAMVSALLFYLYDVRSVFLPGAGALKWVGFCFAVATVLIARYARQTGDHDGRTLYTGVLSIATIFVMIQSPWEAPSVGWLGPLTNGLIIFVVWRFASALTDRLSADLDERPEPRQRLFGLARLEMERLKNESDRPMSIYDLGRRARRRSAEAQDASVADPERAVRDVAVLVLVGLGLFAVGEPLLLTGPPAAGQRALGAMIVFLFAAGCVMAAASSYRGVRNAWSLGAETSATGVAGRLSVAGIGLLLVLVVALGLPGVHYQGTGERQPIRTSSGNSGELGDASSSEGRTGDGESQEGDASGAGGSSGDASGGGSGSERGEGEGRGDRGDGAGQRDPRRSPSATASASPVVSAVASLGQWLRWPLIVLGVLVGAWLAWRFAPVLRRGLRQLWASVSTFWSGWFEGWRAWWRRRRRATRSARRRDDPLADWRDLESAPPRDAVLGAYGRMLDALEVLDHPRSPEHTPLDLLARWPAPWRDGRAAARRLTDVYLQAAYAPDAVPEAARREALTALADLRAARDQRAAIEARSR